MDDLTWRMHDLPAELFNDIKDLVFSLDTDTVHINLDYKPPALLQVNRATREQFATAYYGKTTFYLYDGRQTQVERPEQLKNFAKWAKTLSGHRRHLIAQVHFCERNEWHFSHKSGPDSFNRLRRAMMMGQIRLAAGLMINESIGDSFSRETVLSTDVIVMDKEGNEKKEVWRSRFGGDDLF